MDTNNRIMGRSIVVLGLTASAIFWLIFSVSQIPLIVPADSNSDRVQSQEAIALCGLALFFVSFGSICLVAGMFERKALSGVVTGWIVTGWIWGSWGVYPDTHLLRYPGRLLADAALLFLIVMGIYMESQSRRTGAG